MTEGKHAIIQQLFQEYDIESANDIQEALKDLLGSTIKKMMKTKTKDHLGYGKPKRSDSENARNGYKPKTLNSSYGSFQIEVPQDRQSSFKPQVVKKRQKDISDIDQKIISMYAKGMTTRQISETINDIKLAAYVGLGINKDGRKEVLTIEIGEKESRKYWLGALNSLKNRDVQAMLILCSDGLTGLKEAVAASFPNTEHQRCIIHMVRNTLKYVANKDMRDFARDLRTIYTAPDERLRLRGWKKWIRNGRPITRQQ